jgi:predicted Zn finger-like uncharacterized protein
VLTSAAASAALIVRCANCQTEFSLDDRQVGPEGASLRCSVCSYVFRVAPKRGGTPTWQIRTIDDMQFFAPDLKTLRAWIAEGRLHPDDQVSRTGKHWLRLGDMPEFSNAFAGFGGLPDVFVPLESPALDSLGPPPSFGGTPSFGGAPNDAGVPGLTQPPSPTGAIQLEAVSESTVRRRVASRELPSAMATEPVLDGRRSSPRPSGPPLPSQAPAVQASVSGEMGGEERPLPSIDALGAMPEDLAVPRAEPRRPSRAIRVAGDTSGIVAAPRLPVESSGQRRAGSMLEAVTSRVQPVVRPAEERTRAPSAAPGQSSSRSIDTAPGAPSSAAATTAGVRPADLGSTPPRTRSRPPGEMDPVPDRRSRRSWPLVAGLGALAGVAVVFGIPTVRDRVFGLAGGVVGSAADPSDDAGADAALSTLDASALAQSEATLRERDDSTSRARAAEIVATRAILSAIEAAIAGEPPSPPEDLDAVASDAGSDPRASVLVVLARGGLADATAADRETQLIAAAAPLWRDPNAGVPTGVIGGLEAIEGRSGLGSIVLSLAYWRGGDERRAKEIAQAQLERAPGQTTAAAIVAALAPAAVGDAPPVPTDPTAGPAPDPAGGAETGAAADAPASDTGDTGDVITLADDGGEAATQEPRLSVDGLISRGCSKVESGDAAGGVKLLEKAHDKRPADVDAMLCLGQGYAKLGSHGTALRYFESTLERSPKFVAALRGAAKSSSRLGKTKKAVEYYERLLELDPGNADAKAYVADHGAGADPATPSTPTPDPDPAPDPAPEPAPPAEPPSAPETPTP